VGCVSLWNCEEGDDGCKFLNFLNLKYTLLLFFVDTFHGCSSGNDCNFYANKGRCCIFCETDLCNYGDLPGIAEKSTTPKYEENPGDLNGTRK
jgi:hypothetical protein